MRKKTLLSWSSGKDSAWSLHVLRQQSEVEVVGLLTTVNRLYQRIAIHAVRIELLRLQAEAVGLALHIIELPYPCTNAEYEAAMGKFIAEAKRLGIECMAFGDLFLEDIKEYREAKLSGTGITPLSPIWRMPTDKLAREMIAGGLRAVVTCVDPRQLDASFAGREFNEQFLRDLPANIDPCGERGEFHTFAFDGPMFRTPVSIKVGEITEREGFIYADLLLSENSYEASKSAAKAGI
ncbi:MAG: ATP-binding protein [Acidobacteria bacterium]|nr:MAG: ATP-binding protein [Acidobacteriota bacterium]